MTLAELKAKYDLGDGAKYEPNLKCGQCKGTGERDSHDRAGVPIKRFCMCLFVEPKMLKVAQETMDTTIKSLKAELGIGDLTVQSGLRRLATEFADALYEKLLKAEKKYNHGNAWKNDDWRESCLRQLCAHIDKGDPLDVAAYCAFAWHHRWSLRDENHSWRPIETAPKDGVMLLGFIPSDYGVEVIWFRQNQWHCYRGNGVQPTHWMALPDWPEPHPDGQPTTA